MTAALVYFNKRKDERVQFLNQIVQEQARTRCDNLCVLDGYHLQDSDRLGMYQYVAVFCADKAFLSSKPESAVIALLRDHGLGSNAKGCVLTVKRGLFSAKFARNMMNGLESIGFKIDYFEVIGSEADARRAGSNIG